MMRYKSVAISPLPGCRRKEMLDNPDRGFRLEVALDVELNRNPFRQGFDGTTDYLHHQYDYYGNDRPKLVQTYFYLSQYEKKLLDEKAFERMQTFFNELRRMKLKAVLRFAYETDFGGPKGPDTWWALKHIEQLSPFLDNNRDVIHVYQAGFIGAWGEWHSSRHELHRKEILEAIMNMVPDGIQVQVRLPLYKNLISKTSPQYGRIGFHDDFIVIEPHEWDGGLGYSSEQYVQMAKEAPFVLVDGELPWGSWSLEKGAWLIDGFGAIKRLSEHCYTSLSLVHNYREDGDDVIYSLAGWKDQEITEEWLIRNKLHYSGAWFKSFGNEKPKKTVFDYIRDHLGYRLEATTLELGPARAESGKIPVRLEIKNHGFAAPIGLKRSELVVLNKKGETLYSAAAGNPSDWHPHEPGDHNRRQLAHSIEAELPHEIFAEGCRLGLRISNAGGEGACLANDIEFENGINILATAYGENVT